MERCCKGTAPCAGVIGYVDDRMKLVKKSSSGLSGRYKMMGQIAVGGAAIGYTFLYINVVGVGKSDTSGDTFC